MPLGTRKLAGSTLIRCLYTIWLDVGGPGAREERQLSTRERRVSGLPGRGGRPARPERVAKTLPIRSGYDNSSPPAGAQRAPSSCSPPRGVAANCAAQRAARARPKGQPKARPKVQPNSFGFGLRRLARATLKDRKSSAHLPPNLSVSGYGVRPGHQRCPAAGPAILRVPEALPHSRKFVLGASPSRRCLRALRLDSLYPNKRTAIPLGIALLAFSL